MAAFCICGFGRCRSRFFRPSNDNERGKGDHKHLRGVETSYTFTTRERLIEDFLADVRAAQAEEEGG